MLNKYFTLNDRSRREVKETMEQAPPPSVIKPTNFFLHSFNFFLHSSITRVNTPARDTAGRLRKERDTARYKSHPLEGKLTPAVNPVGELKLRPAPHSNPIRRHTPLSSTNAFHSAVSTVLAITKADRSGVAGSVNGSAVWWLLSHSPMLAATWWC